METNDRNPRNRYLNRQHQARFMPRDERFRISWAFVGSRHVEEVYAKDEETARSAREALFGNDRVRQVAVHRMSDGERIENFNREVGRYANA